MKNKIVIFSILLFLLGALIGLNPLYLYRNYMFYRHVEDISTKEFLDPEDLVPFEYDNLYVIYPYTSKEDLQKQIGFKSRYIKENNSDRYQNIVITKNKKIISYISLSFDYSFQSAIEDNKISSSNDTIIKVYKHEEGCSFIEQYKSIEHSYYDIKFTLPGSYWEEDDEEEGEFYYLDIDSDEYLLVIREDSFNYKNYIKNKNVIKSDDLHINDFTSKYIEISNDENVDLVYVLYMQDSTYLFRMNSLKENIDENKETLYNIIQTVRE